MEVLYDPAQPAYCRLTAAAEDDMSTGGLCFFAGQVISGCLAIFLFSLGVPLLIAIGLLAAEGKQERLGNKEDPLCPGPDCIFTGWRGCVFWASWGAFMCFMYWLDPGASAAEAVKDTTVQTVPNYGATTRV